MFDGVVDFDKATLDPADRRAEGGVRAGKHDRRPGDKLHPNRAGYLAMGNSIDLEMVMGKKKSQASR